MTMPIRPEIRQLVKAARRAGWVVTFTRSGHLRFEDPPTGATVHTAATPGDCRTPRNARADLRRAGLAC